ncbi:hypothetical protein [Enterobacter cloacae]|uniref:hypothetical protein n=1 Tax=Enterobacter cloacae TaxID=550 RepID=UPI001122958F|nr:hypothetical protein [Enterobacter cloacae]TOZ47177.1 hypothetical protein DK925_09425 [Enterobacter cloacae]
MANNIKQRVDDAIFLIKNERYEAALLLLLTAIDGSAAKIFPKGTASISTNKKNMDNSERYQRFLGVRLRQIMNFAAQETDYYKKEMPTCLVGVENVEEHIYKAFRCNDVHESMIPEELHYVYAASSTSTTLCIEISRGVIKFSEGFLSALIDVIKMAPCNGKEFDIHHYRVRPLEGLNEQEFCEFIVQKYKLSHMRTGIIFSLLQCIGPCVSDMNDKELKSALDSVIENNQCYNDVYWLNRCEADKPLWEAKEGITEFGLVVILDIIKRVEIIDIAT